MRKNLIKKFLIVVLLISCFEVLIICKNVRASSSDSLPINNPLEEIEQNEEKIMMYDSVTKQTTEVDIDYEAIETKLEKLKKDGNYYSTPSYNPRKKYEELNVPRIFSTRAIDNRVFYNAHENDEFHPMCKIFFGDQTENEAASGCMIAGKYLLTAAHCVFESKDKPRENWTAYAGYSNRVALAASGWAKVYYSNYCFDFDGSIGQYHDWAICELWDSIGDVSGWYSVTYFPDAYAMRGEKISAYGYPVDVYNGEYLAVSDGEIVTPSINYFDTNCYAYGGQSGGPIMWRGNDKGVLGVSIQRYNNFDLMGTRIDEEMYDLIIQLFGL